MPLNYSKWDQLEVRCSLFPPKSISIDSPGCSAQLSDDSDIEGHPNVDKKSLIRFVYIPILVSTFHSTSYSRWKQRDIHEKREARNHHIAELEAEVACNDVLLTRLRAFQRELTQSGKSRFSSEVERLRTSPSPDAPITNAPKPIPYDEMILRLLEMIAKEARETAGSDEGKLEKLLEERLEFHVKKLSDVTEERREEKDTLLKEKAKHITMDDLHDGFDSKVPCSSLVISSAQFPLKSSHSMFLRSPNPPQLPAKERERKSPRRARLKCSTREHPRLLPRYHYQRHRQLRPTLMKNCHT
jgi:cell division cycle protein 37